MRVSVIIPTYNRARMLPLALDSVLGQTVSDFEILVVDDGSQDNTAEIAASYVQRMADRIKYFQKPNGGCASARNYGLRRAQGEYIVFLDSDDWLLPRKLELQVACLEAEGADIVFGPWYDYYADIERHVGPLYPVAFEAPEGFSQRHFMNTNFSFSCALVRRKCFELPSGPFDENMRWNEDSDLAQRIALAGYQWAACPYPSFVRRVHSGGKSQNRARIYEHLLSSAVRVGRDFPEFRATLGANYERRLAELHVELARAQFREGCAAVAANLDMARQLAPQAERTARDLRFLTTAFGSGRWRMRDLIPDRLRNAWRKHGRVRWQALQRLVGRVPAQRPEQVPGAPPVA